MSQAEPETVHRAVDQLDRLVEAAREFGDDWLGWNVDVYTAIPTGASWSQWLSYVRRLLTEVPPAPPRSVDGGSGMSPRRKSDFGSEAERLWAAELVVAAHQVEVEAWLEELPTREFLHLYAALPQEAATWQLCLPEIPGDDALQPLYMDEDLCESWMRDRLDEELFRWTGSVAASTWPLPDHPWAYPGTPLSGPYEHPARHAVVVMGLDDDGVSPAVLSVYPEVPLQTAWRERFPDLVTLFGGMFYQRPAVYGLRPGSWWEVERSFLLRHPREVRGPMAEQLGELLATATDEELRDAVEAFGSYVVPAQLRRWVTGIHRRMTWIDWPHDPTAWRFPVRAANPVGEQ